MKVIQLRHVLQEMEKGPFAITFIKADRQRNTGGVIETYENCQLYKPAEKAGKAGNKENTSIDNSLKESRNPHHYLHGTRNVQLQNGSTRKIHIRLIVKFNGLTVVY